MRGELVRVSLPIVLGELFGETQRAQAHNRMSRSIAHSVLEGARQALEQQPTQGGRFCPGSYGEDLARVRPYAIHTALGLL